MIQNTKRERLIWKCIQSKKQVEITKAKNILYWICLMLWIWSTRIIFKYCFIQPFEMIDFIFLCGICILSEGWNMVSLAEIVFSEVGYFCIPCLAYLKTHIPGEQLAPMCTQFLFVDKALLIQHPPFDKSYFNIPLRNQSWKFSGEPMQATSCALILFCQVNWQLSWPEDECGRNKVAEDWKVCKTIWQVSSSW